MSDSMKMGAGGAKSGNFELCPPGPQPLVCCDVIDHGLVMSPGWGNNPPKEQHKISLRWQSAYKMKDGRAYIVQKRYTLSAHKKSTLRQDLEKWRGRKFTDDEARNFEINKLIGVNCFANIVHIPKARGVFAEIESLMPPLPSMPKLIVDPTYVRVKDKEKPGPEATRMTPPAQAVFQPAEAPDPFADAIPGPPSREPGDEDGDPDTEHDDPAAFKDPFE